MTGGRPEWLAVKVKGKPQWKTLASRGGGVSCLIARRKIQVLAEEDDFL